MCGPRIGRSEEGKALICQAVIQSPVESTHKIPVRQTVCRPVRRTSHGAKIRHETNLTQVVRERYACKLRCRELMLHETEKGPNTVNFNIEIVFTHMYT
jgi:hypothetical protein